MLYSKLMSLRVKVLIVILLLPISLLAHKVNVYIVDRDDYEFKNVEFRSSESVELGTDFKTLVLVYDRYRKEIISGWGSYEYKRPSNEEFKKIVKDAIFDSYNGEFRIRSSQPKKISISKGIGLYWGMTMDDAFRNLKAFSFDFTYQDDETHIMCAHELEAFGIKFDFFRVGFFNKRNLSNIHYVKIVPTVSEAKKTRDELYASISTKYSKERIKKKIDSDGFRSYSFTTEYEGNPFTEIFLEIVKFMDGYAVSVLHDGYIYTF